jgi:hypothetical protein
LVSELPLAALGRIDSLEAGLRVERALGWLATDPPALDDDLTLRETQLEATKRALGGSVDPGAKSALDLNWAEKQFAREPELEPEALYHRRWALTGARFHTRAASGRNTRRRRVFTRRCTLSSATASRVMRLTSSWPSHAGCPKAARARRFTISAAAIARSSARKSPRP